MKKKYKIFAAAAAGITLLGLFFYTQNNSIVTTHLSIKSKKLPDEFSGYTIVHLSDLHSKSFGKNQSRLMEELQESEPDLVVFTGDLVDSRRYNEKTSMKGMDKLTKIAPVYYVTGNHEARSGKFNDLEKKLEAAGVFVMRNTFVELERHGASIQLLGVDDPLQSMDNNESKAMNNVLTTVTEEMNEDDFKILLSHRPELFSLYRQFDLDLVFSGHAHGGQIRFPFIGGVIAPGQGVFPEYTAGVYSEDDTSMIVSRGLGNSLFPLRVFNRPEIIVTTLISDKNG
ncbi:metallophosphoesterase [Jeotgalibacillus sp. ET6]|uniref:metallophosphoesterase n=1 Tax=Jeotgalibacillus sp. ET6 TaxID=3037260 RepID=UPI0024182022|nr:metallophosphoesterase [Jeotgalibacillus sp. ET6]MDG5473524.1 metallophosphoesterase [Jeotgalibacillus sp. ET6]